LEKYPSYLQTLPTTEVNIPGNMVRIIFVEKVLEEYPYPAIIKKVKLKIVDNLIEENNVIVEIDINQDNVTISEVETHDYVLDIMELSELIFTGKTTIKELQEVFVNSKTAIVDKY
jgi:predicted acetyltransferase